MDPLSTPRICGTNLRLLNFGDLPHWFLGAFFCFETMALTIRQEKFAQEYVITGNASAAYRSAYPGSLKWKPESVNQKASALCAHVKVSSRVAELKAEAAKKYEVTIESVVQELSDIMREARDAGQFGPAISGAVKKAELFGLFKKHQEQGGIKDLVDALRHADRIKE